MTALYLRPDADSVDGNWTTETGSTSLFGSIDESAAGDTDFILSGINPVADVCKISLSNPSSGVTGPGVLNYRYKKTGTGIVNLIVRLKQGATLITTFTHNNISDTFATANSSIPGGDFSSITDFNDLYIEFQADYVATLLDTLSATALNAYSTRKLRSAYSGSAIRVRESGADGEADIGFSSDELDTAALASHVGANNGLVRTWYDQAGANNAVQATNGVQPRVRNSGTNETINSKVAVRFNNVTGANLLATNATAQPITYAICFRTNDGADAHLTDAESGGRLLAGFAGGYTDYQLFAGGSLTGGTPDTTNTHTMIAVFDTTSSEMFIDGTSVLSGNAGANSPSNFHIGAGAGPNSYHGHICEFIRFNGVISSGDRGLIRTSWQNYWGAV